MADETSLSGILLPGDPVVSGEAASKNYVDAQVQARQLTSQKDQAGGYAGLKPNGRISTAQRPEQISWASSLSVTSSTAYVSTSMSFNLDASSLYFLDGYLVYTAPTAGDIAFRWSGTAALSSSSSTWSLFGAPTSTTTTISTLDFTTNVLTGGQNAGGTGGLCACFPRGFLYCNTAGTFTLQMAQATANATASTLSSFSWVRLSPSG